MPSKRLYENFKYKKSNFLRFKIVKERKQAEFGAWQSANCTSQQHFEKQQIKFCNCGNQPPFLCNKTVSGTKPKWGLITFYNARVPLKTDITSCFQHMTDQQNLKKAMTPKPKLKKYA